MGDIHGRWEWSSFGFGCLVGCSEGLKCAESVLIRMNYLVGDSLKRTLENGKSFYYVFQEANILVGGYSLKSCFSREFPGAKLSSSWVLVNELWWGVFCQGTG